jgi:hypothetical protein
MAIAKDSTHIWASASPPYRGFDFGDLLSNLLVDALSNRVQPSSNPGVGGGASMPHPGDLPDDLKGFTQRKAMEVSLTRFLADSELLIKALERVLGSSAKKTALERKELERQKVGSHRAECLRSCSR